MSLRRVYLDHNATSPPRPETLQAFRQAAVAGNPSSIHRDGQAARARIEAARAAVARLVGAPPASVCFTSGGTEANNAALRHGGLVAADGAVPARLLLGATEHPSVLSGHGFAAGTVDVLPVGPDGIVAGDALAAALARRSDERCLVSIQAANGETGIVQPIADLAGIVHAAGGVLHVDAVQAAGRIPIDMTALGADALSLSAHKLGGLPGAGALVVAPGREGPAAALLRGGGQEHGRRGGTENAPAIAGFGAAAEAARGDLAAEAARVGRLRDRFEAEVLRLAPDAVVFGAGVPRLPNTLAFAVPGLPAETALIGLDLRGIAVSSGSACSSGKVGRSHVLAAMGVPADLAAGAIRISLGWTSSDADLAPFSHAFASHAQRLYERRMARAA